MTPEQRELFTAFFIASIWLGNTPAQAYEFARTELAKRETQRGAFNHGERA